LKYSICTFINRSTLLSLSRKNPRIRIQVFFRYYRSIGKQIEQTSLQLILPKEILGTAFQLSIVVFVYVLKLGSYILLLSVLMECMNSVIQWCKVISYKQRVFCSFNKSVSWLCFKEEMSWFIFSSNCWNVLKCKSVGLSWYITGTTSFWTGGGGELRTHM
jgi:hypothetical protein